MRYKNQKIEFNFRIVDSKKELHIMKLFSFIIYLRKFMPEQPDLLLCPRIGVSGCL